MNSENLVRVTAPHFVAGLTAKNGVVTEAAPILRWSVGWRTKDLAAYFDKKHWTWEIVDMKAVGVVSQTQTPATSTAASKTHVKCTESE